MTEAKIGTVDIGGIPKIVSVIYGPKAPKLASKSEKFGADLLECRLDLYLNEMGESADITKYIQSIKARSNLPIIATIRKLEQGGSYFGDEKKRLKLFLDIIPYADAIDIELEAKEINQELIKVTKNYNKTVIVSNHDDLLTPPLESLTGLAERAYQEGADIVKIASLARSKEDVMTLARLLLDYDKAPIAVIATGSIGRVSRLVFPLLGSCLAYSCIDKPVAVGQPHVEQSKRFISTYDPKVIEEIIRNINHNKYGVFDSAELQ